MKRAEAEALLEVAHEELGRIPVGHRAYVIGRYEEIHGPLEDSQMQLVPPAQDVSHGTVEAEEGADVEAPRRETQRGRIIELLATEQVGKAWLAEEIAEQTGFPLNSVSTRMSELVERGWASGAGPKRETRHGEKATTYVPTKKTLDHFREEAERALAVA